MYSVQYTMYSVQYTMYSVQYTMYINDYTYVAMVRYSVHYTVYTKILTQHTSRTLRIPVTFITSLSKYYITTQVLHH